MTGCLCRNRVTRTWVLQRLLLLDALMTNEGPLLCVLIQGGYHLHLWSCHNQHRRRREEENSFMLEGIQRRVNNPGCFLHETHQPLGRTEIQVDTYYKVCQTCVEGCAECCICVSAGGWGSTFHSKGDHEGGWKRECLSLAGGGTVSVSINCISVLLLVDICLRHQQPQSTVLPGPLRVSHS